MLIGGALAVAAVVAIVAPGGASGGDDASQPYPTRQLSIMAPAAAGGGWDTTARAFQDASQRRQARRRHRGLQRRGRGRDARALPARLEVLGRPLPADDDRARDARGDRDQRLRRPALAHDADRDDDHRERGDRRAREVEVPLARASWSPTSSATRARSAGPAARRARPTSCWSASWRGRSAPTRRRRSTSRTRAAARPTPRSCRARSTPASPGCRSSSTRSRAARCACSRSPPPSTSRSAASKPQDAARAGHRPRADQLAGAGRAARGSPRASASGSPAGSRRCSKTPEWQENVERYDWTPFVKTGRELDDFVASEQKRVQAIVDDLGIGK